MHGGTTIVYCCTDVAIRITHSAAAQYSPTCQSLDNVASSAQSMTCTRNTQCDTVNCTTTQAPFDGIPLTLTVLPCRVPPAVHMVVRDKDSDAVILDRVMDHTETGIIITPGVTLDFTLNQLNDSIGVEVCVHTIPSIGENNAGIFMYREIL